VQEKDATGTYLKISFCGFWFCSEVSIAPIFILSIFSTTAISVRHLFKPVLCIWKHDQPIKRT